ncbi:MAG: DNA-3-methyladenine glycosylase [Dehalococcoidia bacterium]
MQRRINARAALAHLREADPVMGRIIDTTGKFAMRRDGEDPFRSLARAIVYQQLSGKAAGTIFGRFLALFERGDGFDSAVRRTDPHWSPLTAQFPTPAEVLAISDEDLRAVGLSRQKAASIRSLAEHFASGELSVQHFGKWEDEEIIAHLTRVRGIGRWTAEMFLMFDLHRPDVLPVNDVGINRAIMKLYGLDAMPKAPDVLRIGEPWRPWATVACWYLWRSEDTQLPTT